MFVVVNGHSCDKFSGANVIGHSWGWREHIKPEITGIYELHYHLDGEFVREWESIVDTPGSFLNCSNSPFSFRNMFASGNHVQGDTHASERSTDGVKFTIHQ